MKRIFWNLLKNKECEKAHPKCDSSLSSETDQYGMAHFVSEVCSNISQSTGSMDVFIIKSSLTLLCLISCGIRWTNRESYRPRLFLSSDRKMGKVIQQKICSRSSVQQCIVSTSLNIVSYCAIFSPRQTLHMW